ncbi:hypothetical protein BTVI_98833 [Pitangus sulphuratus]|nr:hypothetical protein BTVI_98833 [Pitangus sulphuratus]
MKAQTKTQKGLQNCWVALSKVNNYQQLKIRRARDACIQKRFETIGTEFNRPLVLLYSTLGHLVTGLERISLG